MQAYRVIGRGFQVGAGALLLLSSTQAKDRVHKLEPLPGGGRVCEGFGLARAKETQAFKAGELLGLTEPPKGQLDLVEEVLSVKGKRDRDDPVPPFLEAVKIHNVAAERAEQERAHRIEQDEAARLADQQQRETEARETAWADEWAATEAIKKDYPKLADYVGARRKEFAEAAKAAAVAEAETAGGGKS